LEEEKETPKQTWRDYDTHSAREFLFFFSLIACRLKLLESPIRIGQDTKEEQT